MTDGLQIFPSVKKKKNRKKKKLPLKLARKTAKVDLHLCFWNTTFPETLKNEFVSVRKSSASRNEFHWECVMADVELSRQETRLLISADGRLTQQPVNSVSVAWRTNQQL